MTEGAPSRAIIRFAIPLILGYLLQQMYLIIDAAIVGRWIGVGALAAVGASSSIMFLVMGFCNGSCAGFAIPVAQAFGAGDYRKMRCYVSNAMRIALVLAIVITLLTCFLCDKILQMVNTPADVFHDAYVFLFLQHHPFHHCLQPIVRSDTCIGQLKAAVLLSHSILFTEHSARRCVHFVARNGC